MNPDGPANHDRSHDAALARSLAQLTSGWKPVSSVAPEALTAARAALASSLIAGKSLHEIHSVTLPVAHRAPVNPDLEAELVRLSSGVAAGPQSRTIAVIRSATAASQNNPTGRPEWTLGARVIRSFGPFQDLQGVLHWVDLIPLTGSIQFSFGSPASPFGVFPVSSVGLPPHTHLSLGAGSVWFLANLLSSSLPAGNFTGFTITGGKLTSSAPLDLQGNVYVIPAGAKLTATLNLSPAPGVSGTGGKDAAAATFTPPANVTIVFTQTGANFQTVADFSASAYGSNLQLHWNHNTPAQVANLPSLIVPCDPASTSFLFKTSESNLFHPSGSASITLGGWALPLAATPISILPEAAGPGGALIEFGTGASIKTALEDHAVPVKTGLLEIATGGLFAIVTGTARPARKVYQLWPLPAPSQLNATIEFVTLKKFLFTFLSTAEEELFLSVGQARAQLDRPVAATGAHFPYMATGLLFLGHNSTTDSLFVVAARPGKPKPIIPIALKNVIMGVDAPTILVMSGPLNGLNLQNAAGGLFFNLRWLLPTLPDPYAANFDLTVIPPEPPQTAGILIAQINWNGSSAPAIGFILLPPPQANAVAGTPFPGNIQNPAFTGVTEAARVGRGANLALLDLSTRVDLFGVALAPFIGLLAESGGDRNRFEKTTTTPAPALALTGMSLSLNSGIIATFALPQSSWEPMESTATDVPHALQCEPASDGLPLLVSSPDFQKLVPFSPGPVLLSNIDNVASGHPFAALFSLPFGLDALIIEPNARRSPKLGPPVSNFHARGGEFRLNIPIFPESFVPNPPATTSTLPGALQLTLKPAHPDRPDAMFEGFTVLDTAHGPFISPPGPPPVPPPPIGYGYTVLGPAGGVGDMFQAQFNVGGKVQGVPLRRIDFSGYGASIFSEWNKSDAIPLIIKVQFETSIGRTGYEVIQAASVIYPYCILVVRTITMQRQNAGWIKRTDSGWQAVSPGQFIFPKDPANTQNQWTNAVHPGALAGVFNVRNIRDQADTINTLSGFQFRKVIFDADLGISPDLTVVDGGFSAPIPGEASPPVLVASHDMVGWVQILPLAQTPAPADMQQLFAQSGILTPAIACSVEVGKSGGLPGTTLRCSAFEVNIITNTNTGAPVPALGVALRGAPQIPRGGGWSLGQRKFSAPAPAALPGDFPLPLVRPKNATTLWSLADVTDVLQLSQPDNFYSLMHSTGTQKVLFESPQIPVGAATPGLQFPKPGPAKAGGVPANPGSPNLGDIASILNSTGLFPDIANAISLLQGAMEQINTIGQGFKYSKTLPFDPNLKVTLVDVPSVLNISLQYADTGTATLAAAQQPLKIIGPPAAQLTYSVDSSASPSWSLSVGPLSFLVFVPLFGPDPILTITGGFHADEHTSAGLTNLNVQMGPALKVVKSVFSKLQALAQYLPGGAGAQLDVALSNGKLTVSESFSIADLPLGVGDLTDVSLNLGLAVNLQPLSVDFAVGIGSPNHPFNWIVSPLAGNGLMDIGVRANKPALTIQAGIGLGLAIDLGIAKGSASVTIAFQIDVAGNKITLMAILNGQASVDVLDGLASASLTLTAALGFSLSPIIPPLSFTPPLPPPPLPTKVTLGKETITLLASCSVGIHISICWVVSISWDGSWQFSQSVTTPEITVGI